MTQIGKWCIQSDIVIRTLLFSGLLYFIMVGFFFVFVFLSNPFVLFSLFGYFHTSFPFFFGLIFSNFFKFFS